MTRIGSFEALSELTPREQTEVGFKGDPGVSNFLVPAGAAQFAIDGAYTPTGDPYTLAGPADALSNPVQLGFKVGDKIRLTAVDSGPGNNLGREFTLVNPATIEVFETVTIPDATSYEFQVFRRLG